MSLRSFSALRCLSSLAALTAAAALTACGGDVYNRFEPTRLYSFGDGHSAMAGDGRKYTVNDTADCQRYRSWNQLVAENYGFAFAACNPSNLTGNRVAQLFADASWSLAEVRAQVEAQLPNLRTGDMVLLQAGMQDVWSLYQQDPTLEVPAEFPGCNVAGLASTLRTACERGADLGRLIQQIIERDARVLAIDVVNQGKTPRGLAEPAQGQRLLKALTDAFNSGFYDSFGNNSRKAAYAQINNFVRLATDGDSNTGTRFRNETSPACTVASALDCTLSTVSADFRESINDYRFVYADDLYFSPQMNRLIGNLAWSRAERHPY
jgi:lysophospholipase L1-like esterase